MKKNIAFVIYSLTSGGAERVVSTLANKLIDDYNVTIITYIKMIPFYKLDARITVVACKNKIKPNRSIKDSLANNYSLFKQIKHYLKMHSIHLAIAFMTDANVLTVLASKNIKIPVFISERNNPKREYTPRFWKILRRFTYPKANLVIVQTTPIKRFYESFIDNSKLHILPNPISSEHIANSNNRIIQKQNIILNVGRLTNQKGQEIAIKAFASLNPLNWELHLIGEGPNRPKYVSLIEELGMSKKIKLLGRRKDITDYYLKSKIFIFPSRYEGFPNALTEAMFLGLPCISTNCPTGPSQLINNGENGILIPMESIKLMSENMSLLINDEDYRKKLGINARNSVRHLTEDKISRRWKQLIEKTLNN